VDVLEGALLDGALDEVDEGVVVGEVDLE